MPGKLHARLILCIFASGLSFYSSACTLFARAGRAFRGSAFFFSVFALSVFLERICMHHGGIEGWGLDAVYRIYHLAV